MTRWGMAIDLDKCSACQACVVACRTENNVPFAGADDVQKDRAIFWNKFFSDTEGEYPDPKIKLFPRPCMHCEKPPCVQVCPVEATYKNDEGLVLIRWDRCIGCKYCIMACPYGARNFNYGEPEFPETLGLINNPDRVKDSDGWEVGPRRRPKGVVEKCTFCVHRIAKAQENGQPVGSDYANGVIPACAQTCPAGAITFGDLDNPDSLVSQLSRDRRAHRLLEELGTRPKVIYLQEG